MMPGPINKDNSGNYVGHRVGSSGIDEGTLMLGKKKRTLSQQIGRFYDRCVEVILHPQQTFRKHKEFREMARGEKDVDRKEVIDKRLSERTVGFPLGAEDIQVGLKKVNQQARAAQNMPVGEEEERYELDRTREARLHRTGEDVDTPLVRDGGYEEELTGIRQKVAGEIKERKAFHQELRSKTYADQHGELNQEIEALKSEVAQLRKEEQLWEARLDNLRWYQRSEKYVPREFREANGGSGKKMTREAIYNQYTTAFDKLQEARKTLADKLEVAGKMHDQQRYPEAQMKVVNEQLAVFKTEVDQQFAKAYENLDPAIKSLLSGMSDPEGFVYSDIVASKIKGVVEQIQMLENSLHKHQTEQLSTNSVDEQAEMLTELAALRIMYGALYRMKMMSDGRESFGQRIQGYLEGKPDPEEAKMVAEAEQKQKEREGRMSRPSFKSLFAPNESDGVSEPMSQKKEKEKFQRKPNLSSPGEPIIDSGSLDVPVTDDLINLDDNNDSALDQ